MTAIATLRLQQGQATAEQYQEQQQRTIAEHNDPSTAQVRISEEAVSSIQKKLKQKTKKTQARIRQPHEQPSSKPQQQQAGTTMSEAKKTTEQQASSKKTKKKQLQPRLAPGITKAASARSLFAKKNQPAAAAGAKRAAPSNMTAPYAMTRSVSTPHHEFQPSPSRRIPQSRPPPSKGRLPRRVLSAESNHSAAGQSEADDCSSVSSCTVSSRQVRQLQQQKRRAAQQQQQQQQIVVARAAPACWQQPKHPMRPRPQPPPGTATTSPGVSPGASQSRSTNGSTTDRRGIMEPCPPPPESPKRPLTSVIGGCGDIKICDLAADDASLPQAAPCSPPSRPQDNVTGPMLRRASLPSRLLKQHTVIPRLMNDNRAAKLTSAAALTPAASPSGGGRSTVSRGTMIGSLAETSISMSSSHNEDELKEVKNLSNTKQTDEDEGDASSDSDDADSDSGDDAEGHGGGVDDECSDIDDSIGSDYREAKSPDDEDDLNASFASLPLHLKIKFSGFSGKERRMSMQYQKPAPPTATKAPRRWSTDFYKPQDEIDIDILNSPRSGHSGREEECNDEQQPSPPTPPSRQSPPPEQDRLKQGRRWSTTNMTRPPTTTDRTASVSFNITGDGSHPVMPRRGALPEIRVGTLNESHAMTSARMLEFSNSGKGRRVSCSDVTPSRSNPGVVELELPLQTHGCDEELSQLSPAVADTSLRRWTSYCDTSSRRSEQAGPLGNSRSSATLGHVMMATASHVVGGSNSSTGRSSRWCDSAEAEANSVSASRARGGAMNSSATSFNTSINSMMSSSARSRSRSENRLHNHPMLALGMDCDPFSGSDSITTGPNATTTSSVLGSAATITTSSSPLVGARLIGQPQAYPQFQPSLLAANSVRSGQETQQARPKSLSPLRDRPRASVRAGRRFRSKSVSRRLSPSSMSSSSSASEQEAPRQPLHRENIANLLPVAGLHPLDEQIGSPDQDNTCGRGSASVDCRLSFSPSYDQQEHSSQHQPHLLHQSQVRPSDQKISPPTRRWSIAAGSSNVENSILQCQQQLLQQQQGAAATAPPPDSFLQFHQDAVLCLSGQSGLSTPPPSPPRRPGGGIVKRRWSMTNAPTSISTATNFDDSTRSPPARPRRQQSFRQLRTDRQLIAQHDLLPSAGPTPEFHRWANELCGALSSSYLQPARTGDVQGTSGLPSIAPPPPYLTKSTSGGPTALHDSFSARMLHHAVDMSNNTSSTDTMSHSLYNSGSCRLPTGEYNAMTTQHASSLAQTSVPEEYAFLATSSDRALTSPSTSMPVRRSFSMMELHNHFKMPVPSELLLCEASVSSSKPLTITQVNTQEQACDVTFRVQDHSSTGPSRASSTGPSMSNEPTALRIPINPQHPPTPSERGSFSYHHSPVYMNLSHEDSSPTLATRARRWSMTGSSTPISSGSFNSKHEVDMSASQPGAARMLSTSVMSIAELSMNVRTPVVVPGTPSSNREAALTNEQRRDKGVSNTQPATQPVVSKGTVPLPNAMRRASTVTPGAQPLAIGAESSPLKKKIKRKKKKQGQGINRIASGDQSIASTPSTSTKQTVLSTPSTTSSAGRRRNSSSQIPASVRQGTQTPISKPPLATPGGLLSPSPSTGSASRRPSGSVGKKPTSKRSLVSKTSTVTSRASKTSTISGSNVVIESKRTKKQHSAPRRPSAAQKSGTNASALSMPVSGVEAHKKRGRRRSSTGSSAATPGKKKKKLVKAQAKLQQITEAAESVDKTVAAAVSKSARPKKNRALPGTQSQAVDTLQQEGTTIQRSRRSKQATGTGASQQSPPSSESSGTVAADDRDASPPFRPKKQETPTVTRSEAGSRRHRASAHDSTFATPRAGLTEQGTKSPAEKSPTVGSPKRHRRRWSLGGLPMVPVTLTRRRRLSLDNAATPAKQTADDPAVPSVVSDRKPDDEPAQPEAPASLSTGRNRRRRWSVGGPLMSPSTQRALSRRISVGTGFTTQHGRGDNHKQATLPSSTADSKESSAQTASVGMVSDQQRSAPSSRATRGRGDILLSPLKAMTGALKRSEGHAAGAANAKTDEAIRKQQRSQSVPRYFSKPDIPTSISLCPLASEAGAPDYPTRELPPALVEGQQLSDLSLDGFFDKIKSAGVTEEMLFKLQQMGLVITEGKCVV